MPTYFFRLACEINAGESTIEQAADELSQLLTDEVHLSLLQGRWSLTRYLSDSKASPYPASAVSRLGLPGFQIVDGSRQPFFTEFPCPLSRAASFNRSLEEQIGEAIGTEVRAHGGNMYNGICLSLAHRSSRGRSHESYRKNPFLISHMGSAAIRGAQKHVMVGVKHFAMNSMQILLENGEVDCGIKVMNKLSFQPIKDALYESGAEALVCADDPLNEFACAESRTLPNDILRDRRLLHDMLVCSDCTWSLKNGPASIRAGLDIEMPFDKGRVASVERALEHSALNWTDISCMTKRIITCQLRYYSKTIQMPLPEPGHIRCPRHICLARRSVAESMVLLKNQNGLLPLDCTKKSDIAVFGTLAENNSTSYSFDDASHANSPPGTSPLEELRKHHNLVVQYESDDRASREAIAASDADVVLLFIRSARSRAYRRKTRRFVDYMKSPKITRTQWHDRAYIHPHGRRTLQELDSDDLDLAKKVLSTAGYKTIVVIEASSTVLIPPEITDKATAILFSSYGGRQYGRGLRDILFREQEPSGRLPFVLLSTKHERLGTSGNRTTGSGCKYNNPLDFAKQQSEKPGNAYPFGFGLGYSVFILKSVWCSQLIMDTTFEVMIDVDNNGARTAAAVVQIYAAKRSSNEDSGHDANFCKYLIGFGKELIPGGEHGEISIDCRLSPLAKFDTESREMCVMPGQYQLYACQFEGDDRAVSSSFRIVSSISL